MCDGSPCVFKSGYLAYLVYCIRAYVAYSIDLAYLTYRRRRKTATSHRFYEPGNKSWVYELYMALYGLCDLFALYGLCDLFGLFGPFGLSGLCVLLSRFIEKGTQHRAPPSTTQHHPAPPSTSHPAHLHYGWREKSCRVSPLYDCIAPL